MNTKVLFITGTSRGFGRIWAEAALKRGDKVIATARDITAINDLVENYGDAIFPIQLEVTDREAGFAAVNKGWLHFGRIDVLINVAGYSLFGAIEETTESEARAQFETNFFGALWITQAVLPIMRKQGSGHIIQVSSVGGVVAFPMLGLYHASKWALEGFSETLAQEEKGFGIKVTIIEPGVYNTSPDAVPPVQGKFIAAYDEVRQNLYEKFKGPKGDPQATADAILKVIDEQDPPLRLFLGTFPYPLVSASYAERLLTWEKWKNVSDKAQGNKN